MIRMATEADLPRMLAIYSPYVAQTAFSFEYTPPTAEEFLQRFRRITAQFPWLVWEEEGCVLGYCYACAPFERAAYRWCAEPSVYLAPKAHRKGIGAKLYAALEATLLRQGYRVLYAIITSENRGSLAFHRACGYRLLADFPLCGYKFDTWHGITWMEKRLNSVETPIDFPVSICDIVNNDENFQKFLDNLPLSKIQKI